MTDTTTDTTPALQISDLGVTAATGSGRQRVVDHVTLDVRSGTISGLAGESGSGKTVTALAAMRLLDERVLRVEEGRIRVGGDDVLTVSNKQMRRLRGSRISMVFQEPMTSLDTMFTIGSSIVEVLRAHRQMSRADAKRRALELLARVGIPDPATRFDAYPFELSGGMRQRVMIAMAIACEPTVLIADEPTTALDVTVQSQIMELFRELAEQGMAILLVTHDMGLISEYTDDLTVMYAGQVVERGATRSVLTQPSHPYTAALIRSVPSPDERLERLLPIDGVVPRPGDMPPGCRFAPRCDHATPTCDRPVPLDTHDGRQVRCVRAGEIDLVGDVAAEVPR